MLRETTTYTGVITRTHGIDGALIIRFDNLEAERYQKAESIFIETDGLLVPFFIEDYTVRDSQTAIVNLCELPNEKVARKVTGLRVFIENKYLKKVKHKASELEQIYGYAIEAKGKGIIGKLTSIIDNPVNPLMVVDAGGREILIPLADQFFCSIDKRGKTILLDLPEGLLDL
jgi:16S rRNA processing protein RimM